MIRGGVDLTTFHPGPQTAARAAAGISTDAHVVLYVANHGDANAYKDFATVRTALANLPDPKSGERVECIVVGASGPDEQIAPQVMLRRVGYVRSREQMADLYRSADVYVHAAMDETYGLSVAEALACGTPVAMASSGGVLELVEHGRTALTVPLRDAAQLGQAITRMLGDRPLRAAMREAAAATARASLDEKVTTGALLDWCIEVHADWHAHSGRHPGT
jgi:D-inositol-3-phosphate glycosyltransferase